MNENLSKVITYFFIVKTQIDFMNKVFVLKSKLCLNKIEKYNTKMILIKFIYNTSKTEKDFTELCL